MRKIAANLVIPIDGAPIKNGYVLFDNNNRVVEVGSLTKECQDTEFYNGILVPGFTNAHCHVELSYLVGYFKQATGMSGFIDQINTLRTCVERPQRIASIEEQMERLYIQGVSAMGDISNCNESFAIKAKSKLYTRTFVEVFGTDANEAEEIIKGSNALAQEAKEMGLDAATTPHSCYTMAPKLLKGAALEGLKSGFISYHNQESPEEEELIRYGTGALADNYKKRGLSTPPVSNCSSLIYFINNLINNNAPIKERVLLVHNITLDQESIDYAKRYLEQPYFAICPMSNIFIHRMLPPLDLMRSNNLKICLGTDSLSSNTILSIVEEIKTIQDNFTHIPLTEILKWSTINGAEAIGKEDKFGSFSIGKQPGAVIIDNIDWDNLKLTKESKSRRVL